MPKRLKRLPIVLVILTTAAAVGVTLAFMFKKAEKTNIFVSGQAACAVHEKMDGTDVTGNSAIGSEKSEIRVENTGNVKTFIRIRMVSYYADTTGNIAGTASSEFPVLTLKNGWIAGENHTYYYPYPVEPGAMTEILCEPVTLGQTQLADGTAVYQVLEVFAEAVQADPVTAVQEAWGVSVNNGVLSVP